MRVRGRRAAWLIFSFRRRAGALGLVARVALMAVAALASAVGCARERPRAHLVASPFAVYDLTRRVAGPDADVSYVGRDARPEALKDLALAVLAGGGLDAELEQRVRATSPKARVVRAADRVPPLGDADLAARAPPHVWVDPQRARLLAKAIAEELARVDPGHAGAHRARADAIDAELEALDRELEARVEAWKKATPDAKVPLAFAYFGDRYHVPVAPSGAPPPPPGALPDPYGVDSYEITLRAAATKLGAPALP